MKPHLHQASHGERGRRNEHRIFMAMLLVGVFMLVEAAGGLLAGSLALLADAAHMLTDTAALALAWSAFRISRRPRDPVKTFGYYRFEVLAAFVNGLALLGLVVWIVVEAVERMLEPREVLGLPMLAVAAAGLAVNLVAFRLLHDADHGNLNIKAALWHVVGDILGSLAAIVAAIVILLTGWTPIDPILSLAVAALLVRAGLMLTRRAAHILMEGAPGHIDPQELAAELEANVGLVCGVHDLHVWLLTAERPLLTAHIEIADATDSETALAATKAFLAERYGITHTTIQVESGACVDRTNGLRATAE